MTAQEKEHDVYMVIGNSQNKTYFIISDIHSFYTETKEALQQAGHDKEDKSPVRMVHKISGKYIPFKNKLYNIIEEPN